MPRVITVREWFRVLQIPNIWRPECPHLTVECVIEHTEDAYNLIERHGHRCRDCHMTLTVEQVRLSRLLECGSL